MKYKQVFIGKKEDSVTATREETFTEEHRTLTTFIYLTAHKPNTSLTVSHIFYRTELLLYYGRGLGPLERNLRKKS